MSKTRKADIMVGVRAAQAVDRYCFEHNVPLKTALCAIGVGRQTYYGWKDGRTPSGISLLRLSRIGIDTKYLLGGKREDDHE